MGHSRTLLLSCAQLLLPCCAAAAVEAPDLPVAFSTGFTSDMVLQRAPAKAALYGFGTGAVSVHVVGVDGADNAVAYTISAQSHADGTWKAFLLPHNAGGSYTVTANNGDSSATLERVTMGDVYFCSGQSNMALETYYTFSAEAVRAEFAKEEAGPYSSLRFFQFGGMSMNTTLAAYTPQYVTLSQSVATEPFRGSWYNASSAVTVVTEPSSKNMTAFDTFSATCLYFGVELIDALGSDAKIPIGLIQSAVGGSTIEAWMSNESRVECTQRMVPKAGLGGGKGLFPFMQHQPGALYYGYVTPFVNMTISGFLWCKCASLQPTMCSARSGSVTIVATANRQIKERTTAEWPT
jgi:sialate O-acetylesterase